MGILGTLMTSMVSILSTIALETYQIVSGYIGGMVGLATLRATRCTLEVPGASWQSQDHQKHVGCSLGCLWASWLYRC